MAKRKIIEIDREKCNGCGLCTTACAEGALILEEDKPHSPSKESKVNGASPGNLSKDKNGGQGKKAVLVKEIFCDGMGACLDVCPVGALKIVERDSAEYDAKASFDHVLKTQGPEAAKKVHGEEKVHSEPPVHYGCPGSMAREIKKDTLRKQEPSVGSVQSELTQWPIQLHLISPVAPYFKECDLLIAADCTAFSLGGFHQDLLKGKKLVIACPKLDETGEYVEKIAELLKNNTVYSLTVVTMEVPCCSGLVRMVQDAVELSGTKMPVKRIVVGLDGTIRN